MKKVKTDKPVIIQLENVSKTFAVHYDLSFKEKIIGIISKESNSGRQYQALHSIDLNISAGTTVGLIGRNGSGKSTLLKIIGGILGPDSGAVLRRGRLAALLELGAGFHPDLTGRENVYLNASILGMTKSETDEQFDNIAAFADIGEFMESQVKYFSSGMYVRLAFAVAIHTRPDILLVDEVLAVGDEAFQIKCMDKIREFQREGGTIIFVSHSMGQVADLCDRVLLLESGKLIFDGRPDPGVDMLREILSGSTKKLESNQSENRQDDDSNQGEDAQVTITRAIWINGEESGEGNRVGIGRDIVFDVELVSNNKLAGLNLGVQINSQNGADVIGYSAESLSFHIAPFLGNKVIRSRLLQPAIGEGRYFVSFALFDKNRQVLSRFTEALSFDVIDTGEASPKSVGVLKADVELTWGA